MARVEMDSLSKRYEGKSEYAARDVSIDVPDGELLVLVGPSGCGKSTVLRMIAGLEEITEGELRIEGARVNEVAPKDRDVAMVFQNYALYPHMTVYDNMAFGLKLRKIEKNDLAKRVRETAELLGLGGYLARRPRELSGGERQRVALGRALVRRPRLFLFDEPLSNLDAKLRVHMRAEISRLHHHLEATMIYVTHDQVEAMTLGDRIAVLKDGLLQQVADPLTLYREPANRFVAGFIGSPSMNVFSGRVGEDGRTLAVGEDRIEISDGHREALAEWKGREVLFGVRPEHFSLEARPWGSLGGRVAVREQLGNEVLLHIDRAEGSAILRVEPAGLPEVDESVRMYPELEASHFFDPSTERAIR